MTRVYTGGVSGISILPSPEVRYERRIETRSTGYPTYKYREFETRREDPPTQSPSVTIYARNFSYNNYMTTLDMGSILSVSLTNTIYADGRSEEGASVCVTMTRRERKEDIDALVGGILRIMNKEMVDKPSITIPLMSSTIAKWRLRIPTYKRLSWMNISMDIFRQSIMVSPPKGERVIYVRSVHGSFLLDDWNRITPLDTTSYSSLLVLSGTYSDTFYPVDVIIDKEVDVRSYPYRERLAIMRRYDLPNIPILENPNTPTDFYSFVVGKSSMIIFSPDGPYLWQDIVPVRVFIGAGGIPLALDKDTLQAVTVNVANPSSHIGDMVEVSKGRVIERSQRPTPMTVTRITSLIQLEEDPITMEDLSGRTCALFTKYVEKVLSLLYSYYSRLGVTGVLDVSRDVGHSYWRTSGITTYAISDRKDMQRFMRESGAIEDNGVIVGDDWEVDDIDIGSVPLVEAVDIVKVPVSIEDLNIYSATATSLLSMMVTESEYVRTRDYLSSWGWTLDSEYRLSEELLPLNPNCMEPLILYTWRRTSRRPETIRLVYNPIAQGSVSKITSPYGDLYRTGTAGAITSGSDNSLLESIYTSIDPSFRRRDKIGKTLYIFSNPTPKLNVPLYLIPPDSWSMYQTSGGTTLVYDDLTPRPPGIVIFKNKGHWEPLAKRSVTGDLVYIW